MNSRFLESVTVLSNSVHINTNESQVRLASFYLHIFVLLSVSISMLLIRKQYLKHAQLISSSHLFFSCLSFTFCLILTLSLCCECCATMMNFQAVLCSPSIRSCGAEINHLIRPAFPYRVVREIHHVGHMGRGGGGGGK